METTITMLGTLAGVLLGWFLRHFIPWSCEQTPQLAVRVIYKPIAGPRGSAHVKYYKIVNKGVFPTIVTELSINDVKSRVAILLSPGEEKDLPLPSEPRQSINLKARCPKGHIHKLILKKWKDGNYYLIK